MDLATQGDRGVEDTQELDESGIQKDFETIQNTKLNNDQLRLIHETMPKGGGTITIPWVLLEVARGEILNCDEFSSLE